MNMMVSDMIGCLQIARIYSPMKKMKLYKHALYNVFLSVKLELNNNFMKEIN